MIKRLIKLANHLDKIGLTEEAGELDDVLQSILQMIEDKSIDISNAQNQENREFDLFINNKGEAVGAEPASGDLGSTCIMNEEPVGEDDVIAEYDVTDVDEGGKESGEEEICVVDVEDSCAMQMTDAILEELNDTLEEWEDKDYGSDKARYKAYYKDIEDIVEEFDAGLLDD